MARAQKPGETGKTMPGATGQPEHRDQELERRRRDLEAAIATRRPQAETGDGETKSDSVSGFGNAMKLSSEFVAGVIVGAGLGWVIDSWAGTSPFGLIVFLLLGFGAGVLNVLRSAGLVAEAGIRHPGKTGKPDR